MRAGGKGGTTTCHHHRVQSWGTVQMVPQQVSVDAPRIQGTLPLPSHPTLEGAASQVTLDLPSAHLFVFQDLRIMPRTKFQPTLLTKMNSGH